MMDYVHGYSGTETARLNAQARTLTELLHGGISYAPGSRILEAGCGVGAQTVALASRNPGARIVSVDRCAESLAQARASLAAQGLSEVEFVQADLFDIPLDEGSFDHLFLCFVLEHVPEPGKLLARLLQALRPGGSVTIIEGDHGSAFFHPDNADARRAIECLVKLQSEAGGNALIGRELYPLMTRVGVRDAVVSPVTIYADAAHPELVSGFTLSTFTAMIEGVEDAVLGSEMMTRSAWERALVALRHTAESDGTFSYMFFRGVGTKTG